MVALQLLPLSQVSSPALYKDLFFLKHSSKFAQTFYGSTLSKCPTLSDLNPPRDPCWNQGPLLDPVGPRGPCWTTPPSSPLPPNYEFPASSRWLGIGAPQFSPAAKFPKLRKSCQRSKKAKMQKCKFPQISQIEF